MTTLAQTRTLAKHSIDPNRSAPTLKNLFAMSSVVVLICCVIPALMSSWHWPLIGDEALMRYVIFLIHCGRTPYLHTVDINLPGSYALEALSMKAFGGSSFSLRIYDGCMSLGICLLLSLSSSGWKNKVASFSAGLFFLLLHLQDGLAQAGQRDLAITFILALSYASFIFIECYSEILAVLVLELCVGFAITIKPTIIMFALFPVIYWLGTENRRHGLLVLGVAGGTGILFAPVAVWYWLWSNASLSAFASTMWNVEVTHGGLGRRNLGFLLVHSVSPVLVLCILWFGLLAINRSSWNRQRRMLLFGAICGLLSYLLQGKGLPYHRYPFLLFLLMLMFSDFAAALEQKVTSIGVGAFAIGVACLGFAPHFLRSVRSFDKVDPFQTALLADLKAHNASSQGVQCLDTYAGCIGALYTAKIVQSTGFLYDCYLFTSEGVRRDGYRQQFLEAFETSKPKVVVLTDNLCFSGNDRFDKLKLWPEFYKTFSRDYVLSSSWRSNQLTHQWNRSEYPASYKIYIRNR